MLARAGHMLRILGDCQNRAAQAAAHLIESASQPGKLILAAGRQVRLRQIARRNLLGKTQRLLGSFGHAAAGGPSQQRHHHANHRCQAHQHHGPGTHRRRCSLVQFVAPYLDFLQTILGSSGAGGRQVQGLVIHHANRRLPVPALQCWNHLLLDDVHVFSAGLITLVGDQFFQTALRQLLRPFRNRFFVFTLSLLVERDLLRQVALVVRYHHADHEAHPLQVKHRRSDIAGQLAIHLHFLVDRAAYPDLTDRQVRHEGKNQQPGDGNAHQKPELRRNFHILETDHG